MYKELFSKNFKQNIEDSLSLSIFVLLINMALLSLTTVQTIDLKNNFLSNKKKEQIKIATDSIKIVLTIGLLIKTSFDLYIYKTRDKNNLFKIILNSINIFLIIGSIALISINIYFRQN